MIRNIITAAILFTALVSMASIAQIASAVEPNLNLDISIYEDSLLTSSHPYAWTPNLSQHERIFQLYESMLLPSVVESSGFSGSVNASGNTAENTAINSGQRLFSFEVYQGDGLDDLRKKSKHHNSLLLPDEDIEAYGVTVKQRF